MDDELIEKMARALSIAAGYAPDETLSTYLGAQGTIVHGIAWTLFSGEAERVLTALTQAGSVIVPREPTAKMVRVGVETFSGNGADFPGTTSGVYRAMVKAALGTKE